MTTEQTPNFLIIPVQDFGASFLKPDAIVIDLPTLQTYIDEYAKVGKLSETGVFCVTLKADIDVTWIESVELYDRFAAYTDEDETPPPYRAVTLPDDWTEAGRMEPAEIKVDPKTGIAIISAQMKHTMDTYMSYEFSLVP